jgi:hypothetical protein
MAKLEKRVAEIKQLPCDARLRKVQNLCCSLAALKVDWRRPELTTLVPFWTGIEDQTER